MGFIIGKKSIAAYESDITSSSRHIPETNTSQDAYILSLLYGYDSGNNAKPFDERRLFSRILFLQREV
jgi:hypothetical protein